MADLNNLTILNSCFNNGNLIIYDEYTGKCDCDIGFFNSNCSLKGADEWNNYFIFYQIIYGFCYVVISGFTCLHLLQELVKEYGNICRLSCRLMKSPKYMVIFNLIIISTTRCVYLAVDPFRQYNRFPRVLDLILYEIIFSVTFSIFLILLLVWTGLHSAFNIDALEDGMNRKKEHNSCEKYKYKIVHTIVLVILFFVYPFQFSFSYIRGTRDLTNSVFGYVLAGCFLTLVFFIIVFVYFTIKFKQALSKNYSKSQKDINHLIKAPTRSKYTGDRPIPSSSTNEDTKKMHIEFLMRLKEQHLLKFFLKHVYSGIESRYNENLSDSEFETEMANIIDDDRSDEINLMPNHINNDEILNENILNENITQKHDKEFEFTYRLSHEDMIVLNNIVKLSLVIILISLSVIIMGTLMLFTKVLTNYVGTLFMIYLSSTFEVIGFFFVFLLFVKEVRSSEYENLKIIGDIENFLKDNKNRTNKLVFLDINKTSIYYRFKNFMNIKSSRLHSEQDPLKSKEKSLL